MRHGLNELFPFAELRLQEPGPGRGQAVVLARRAVARLMPCGVDQTLALQATQQRVERAFGSRQRLPVAQRGGQLIAIVG